MKKLYSTEDWLAVWVGTLLLVLSSHLPAFPKINRWNFEAIYLFEFEKVGVFLIIFFILLLIFIITIKLLQEKSKNFIISFSILFILSLAAKILSSHYLALAYGFGYAFWALFIGLAISNLFQLPKWFRESLKAELFVKIGLVLLGAEILFSKMLVLGVPALIVAWGVTPIVIVFMYYIGTRVLKLDDKLSIVTAAATSVCGVSAAVAVSAACRAKKEILTLSISMTLIFTVVMMVAMPGIVQYLELEPLVGGAWIGGTIDSTGAVVAAGAVLGQDAMDVAAIVKMIQNIMVGVVAFIVAVIWAVDIPNEHKKKHSKVSWLEIWNRFPKFIVGFIGISLVFSFVLDPIIGTQAIEELTDVSKTYRSLLFTLAFLAIGLESNFKELASHVQNGKPIYLYIIGQSFNILLTLIVAYLVFGGFVYETIQE